MSSHLKDALKKHYQSQELSPRQLENLRQLHSYKFPIFQWTLAASTGFVVAFLLSSWLFYQNTPLLQRIAQEVSYNHRKDMPSEIITSNYDDINRKLDRLDFKVVESQKLGPQYALVGGRYCSIQSHIAAQLQIENTKSQKMLTLYQFSLNNINGSLESVTSSLRSQGVKVKIWKEGSVGFALAGEE